MVFSSLACLMHFYISMSEVTLSACQRYLLQCFKTAEPPRGGQGAAPDGMVPSETRTSESEDDMNRECTEIKELLVLYYAGKLSEEQKAHLNQHLLFCPECMYHMVLMQAS
jgi:hypothetical protein